MKKLITETLNPGEQWNKVYDLVYNTTLEHDFNEYELRQFIENITEKSQEFQSMEEDEIDDAAWAGFEDARKQLDEI